MKAHRSKRYCDWLRHRFPQSHFSLSEKATDLSHPHRCRPWIGEVSPGRFGPGTEKASDYGSLMLTHLENMRESASDPIKWGWTYGFKNRDLIAVQNLVWYVEEELDPGIDLWAEMVEWAQKRVKELEDAPEG